MWRKEGWRLRWWRRVQKLKPVLSLWGIRRRGSGVVRVVRGRGRMSINWNMGCVRGGGR